jgi:hypothetical protein
MYICFHSFVVRCLGHDPNPRHDLRVAGQHHEREDLRLPLVLAHHPQLHDRPQPRKKPQLVFFLYFVANASSISHLKTQTVNI